jgi:hypothetical protein
MLGRWLKLVLSADKAASVADCLGRPKRAKLIALAFVFLR